MKKVLFFMLLSGSITAQAQKVSNKLTFNKGQKLEVVTNVTSASEMMGQSMNMNMTTTKIWDVENVAGGNTTIESKIKRMQFKFEGMGQNQSFDSENEADMKGEGGKTMEKALKNKFKMTVDPTGKIVAVKADDNNPNKETSASTDPMAGMMEGMIDGFSLPKAGDVTEFSILPAKEVGKGDSWTDTVSKVKDEKRKITYKIADITATDILVDYTEEVATKTTKENMGMEVTIDKKDTNTGKITLDRKTGLMKQKTENIKTTGTASVMGQEIPLDSKGTKTVTVKMGS